jgi:hypothetical protein
MITSRRRFSKGSLHGYLLKHHPPKDECEHCGSREYPTQHALKHGSEYTLDINDYLDLCPKCHKQYDYHLGDGPECNCNLEEGTLYPHGWNYAKISVPVNTTLCEYCSGPMLDKRSTAKYCSERCSTNAYRVRHGQAPIVNLYTECQNPNCDNPIPEGAYYKQKYCKSSCSKAVYNRKDNVKERAAKRYDKAKEKINARKALILAEQESERIANEYMEGL